jgi:hypothetical protein
MILHLIVFFTLPGSICSLRLAGLLPLFARKRLHVATGGLIPLAVRAKKPIDLSNMNGISKYPKSIVAAKTCDTIPIPP